MRAILFILGLLMFVSCGKKVGTYNGKVIEYSEHTFGKQVDLYNGKKVIKKFKYLQKERISKKELLKTWIKTGQYDCDYYGWCYHYSYVGKSSGWKWGYSSSCDGERFEKRKYTTHKVSPSLKYSSNRNSITLILKEYESTGYKTLERGKCSD